MPATVSGATVLCTAEQPALAGVVAFAHGWVVEPGQDGADLRLHRSSP